MKVPLKILLPLLLSMAMNTSCTQKSNINRVIPVSATAPVLEKEGGITSGGGGTLPAEHPNPEEVGVYVRSANTFLLYYFKLLDQVHHDDHPIYLDKKNYFKILFDGETTIYDILDTKTPEILYDRPCLDFAGNEVDGSIRSSTRGQYCISAYLIASKISKSDTLVEVTALVAHELSHFLGTDEPTAYEVQKDLTRIFRSGLVNEKTLDIFVKNEIEVADQISQYLGNFQEAVKSPDKAQKIINDLYEYSRYRTIILEFGYYGLPTDHIYREKAFALLSESEKQQYYYYQDQTFAVEKYVCTQQTKYPDQQARCQKTIDDVFKGRDFVEWQEINPKAPIEWKHKPIYRIKTLAESANFVETSHTYYSSIAFIFAWGPINVSPRLLSFQFGDSKAVNPWEKYIGKYNVVAQNCSSDLLPEDQIPHVSTIEITPHNFVTQKVLSMKETSGLIETVSYFPTYLLENSDIPELAEQGTGAVYLNNEKAHRMIYSESRNTRPDLLAQTDIFEMTTSGFKLKRTKFIADRNRTDYVNPKYFECNYSLEKESN